MVIGIFSTLYLTFANIFGKRLEAWDFTEPGFCYNTHRIAAPSARHPYVDRIYLGITALFMFSALFGSCMFAIEFPKILTGDEFGTGKVIGTVLMMGLRFCVLVVALLQYPVHLYSIFALRTSNEHLLTGESENKWGFGQIVALVMIGQTLIECFRGYRGMLLPDI